MVSVLAGVRGPARLCARPSPGPVRSSQPSPAELRCCHQHHRRERWRDMVGGAAAAPNPTTTHYFRYHESDKTMTVTTVQWTPRPTPGEWRPGAGPGSEMWPSLMCCCLCSSCFQDRLQDKMFNHFMTYSNNPRSFSCGEAGDGGLWLLLKLSGNLVSQLMVGLSQVFG